jgi:hypothetical protein
MPHVQGYVEFGAARRWTVLRDHIGVPVKGQSFRCARAFATSEQNIAYCTKVESRAPGEEPFRAGEPGGGQGARNDLEEIRTKLVSGVEMATIADEHFGSFLRYGRGMKEYTKLKGIAYNVATRHWKTLVIVLWGDSYGGKTRTALSMAPDACMISRGNSGTWFDNYTGQACVIMDEFDGSWMPASQLKQLLDAGPMFVDCKGTQVAWTPRVVFLCSNYDPCQWYVDNGLASRAAQDTEAIMNRIDVNLQCSKTSDDGFFHTKIHKLTIPPHHCFACTVDMNRDVVQSEDCSLCSTFPTKHSDFQSFERGRSDMVIIHHVTCPRISFFPQAGHLLNKYYFSLDPHRFDAAAAAPPVEPSPSPPGAPAPPTLPPAEDVEDNSLFGPTGTQLLPATPLPPLLRTTSFYNAPGVAIGWDEGELSSGIDNSSSSSGIVDQITDSDDASSSSSSSLLVLATPPPRRRKTLGAKRRRNPYIDDEAECSDDDDE